MQLARSSALAEETGTALVVGGAGGLGASATFMNTDVLSEDSVNTAIGAVVAKRPAKVSVDTHGGPGGIISMMLPAARDLSVVGIRLDAAIRFQIKGSRS